MGMFDIVYSNYIFSDDIIATEYQTKDVENFIGGTLSEYWIDPSGLLWSINYKDTYQIKVNNNSKIYKEKTGLRGKISPYKITKWITIYPSKWKEDYANWPHIKIKFVDGKLIEYSIDIVNFYEKRNSVHRDV